MPSPLFSCAFVVVYGVRSGISYAMLSPFEDRKVQLGRGDDAKKDHASALVQQAIESSFLQRFDAEAWEDERTSFHLSDALVFVQAGVGSLAQDDFTECFTERPPRAWNWNPFLYTGWIIGLLIRHLIFLPLRLVSFFLGSLLCACTFPLVWFFSSPARRERNTAIILVWWARVWVLSIGAVISVRGVIPGRRPNQIWVANHSTPLDFAWLLAQRPCASVGQLHGGFIGFWQTVILRGLKCIWFQRFEADDRLKASARMRAHAATIENPPLVLFPEGVCVNNEYCVMFRKGAFELGCEICPIAIKYEYAFSSGLTLCLWQCVH
jgi:glycerol-3-phosphate O-acyltransferase 3/4